MGGDRAQGPVYYTKISGIYDEEYISYIIEVLKIAGKYEFKVFIDPHQDVWSRFTGGSGAPHWTLELAGFEPRNFGSTNAAILHHEYPNPLEFPKMIWPTNYFKLAAATMFTLFFAGKIFAPRLLIEGTNIQDYLQNHFINSIKKVAQAVMEAGLNESVVIGYDTLNEPHPGWIGLPSLGSLSPGQELRKGTCPTPFQALLLGSGRSVDVDFWEMGSLGPRKIKIVPLDPKGKRAWKTGSSCIWANHGVWDAKTDTILIDNYFSVHPKTGEVVDFISECWKPFINNISGSLRSVHPECIIFVEPPVNHLPPVWTPKDINGRLCYTPHWYDGLTLISKSWNRCMNVDYLGFLRGKYSSIATAVKFGERNIRNCFKSQLKMIRSEGEEYIGTID